MDDNRQQPNQQQPQRRPQPQQQQNRPLFAPELLNLNRVRALSVSAIIADAISVYSGRIVRIEDNSEQLARLNLSKLKTLKMSNTSDVRALEHQTLKVPYEMLNKKFRLAQKTIDREVAHVNNSINDLDKALEKSTKESVPVTAINDLLNGVINKLTVLKRKSIENINDEIDAVKVCKRRIEHLKEYQNLMSKTDPAQVPTDLTIGEWRSKRMDRMIVDHCLRSGYYETAVQLSKYSNIDHLTNIEMFLVCKTIEESLEKRETTKCLNWCHDNRSKLRKIKSTLEFSLRQQEFIELVRTNQRMEAVRYAQKYFCTFDDLVGTSAQSDLEQVMGLLAYTPKTQIERYQVLFDEKRWHHLVAQFRVDNFKLYQLSDASIFSITLQAGLSSLKTPHCYRKDGIRNSDCPICSELLNKLAATLPCAHCSQSRLVCYISNEPMNEHNPPMMLPNGFVYGERALKKMAEENGLITCPRTGAIFSVKECEKVYVM